MKYEAEMDKLFEELVPVSGKAESKAGELVRAVSRIGYRFFNDGDMIGKGYGKETCNPAARFLIENGDKYVRDAVWNLWEAKSEDEYENLIDDLCFAVIEQINDDPELKTTPNNEDMFDYATDEDVDDEDWEDESDDDWNDDDDEEDW